MEGLILCYARNPLAILHLNALKTAVIDSECYRSGSLHFYTEYFPNELNKMQERSFTHIHPKKQLKKQLWDEAESVLQFSVATLGQIPISVSIQPVTGIQVCRNSLN